MTSFRTNDLGRWGTGLGRNLTPTEVDLNWWDITQRVTALEALPDAPPMIESFSSEGASFYVHFDNDVTMGPYDLPTAMFRVREDGWLPNTFYQYLDVFPVNGVLYAVLLDHTSAADTFDPGDNDGSGNNFYYALLTTPGNSFPTGGAVGQVTTKSTTEDFAVTWSWKTPEGGTTGQFLRQASNTQDDTEWAYIDASEVDFTPATGSPLTGITDVAEALESLASDAASGVALSELTDVLFATGEPTAGQLLWFDGSDWIPIVAPTNDGDMLQWDGNEWAPVSWLSVRRDGNEIALGSLSSQTNIDPTDGDVFTCSIGNNIQFDAVSAPVGARITIVINTISATPRNLTFVGNFKSQGTLSTGSVSGKVFTITFVGDGTNMNEVARTTAM
jgi:hypothetical protein